MLLLFRELTKPRDEVCAEVARPNPETFSDFLCVQVCICAWWLVYMYVRWSFVLEMVFVFVRDVLLQACDDHESVSLPVHKYSINIQYYI